MKIIEQYLEGKYKDESKCEDAIVVANKYLAVIDGATAKGKKRINKKQSGKAIADAIAHYLTDSERSLSGQTLVSQLSTFVYETLLEPNGYHEVTLNSPSAAIAVYTIETRTITVVGDISVMINKLLNRHQPKFDKTVSEVRSIVNWLARENFETTLIDRQTDAGRKFILPLLRRQHLLRNIDTNNPWGYGNIDGFNVPKKYITIYQVEPNQEIVLCSDGYPVVEDSLAKSEEALIRVLCEDPLQTLRYFSTKGAHKEQDSFDDRAYLKFVS